jgi:ABC-type bacteriocin/lantibiotic exporter with double-glycine peptidase domain
MHKSRFSFELLFRCVALLPRREKIKVSLIVLFQLGLAILDLVGVALIGLLGALSVTGIQSSVPSKDSRVFRVLDFLNLESMSFQSQAAIIGLLAAVILTSRTLVSIFFARRALYFLTFSAARISSDLFRRILTLSLMDFRAKSSQEILYILSTGVNTITVGIIGTCMALATDFFIMALMISGLFVINAPLALGTLASFGLIGFSLYKLLHKRAKNLGEENARLSIQRNEKILEVMRSYREVYVKGRREFYGDQVEKIRYEMAQTESELSFMPNISKYALEIATVLGGIVLCGTVFYFQDAKNAIATLVIFLAAGSRIAPAVLRFQQGALYVKSSIGSALPALDLIESVADFEIPNSQESAVDFYHKGFNPVVTINGLNLMYPGKSKLAVQDLSLEIDLGKTIAVVGPSGAGKTSLVDLMLGVITPTSGEILISGLLPREVIKRWPCAIGYVPQDVSISSGTIKENVCLGYSTESFTDDEVWEALIFAQLANHVRKLEGGLNAQVGESGTQLSGGQRQRLGIARAMVTKPKLLILDEATSSLDGQTESALTESLLLLHGSVTVVVVAHRLSTIKSADVVVYMEEGEVKAKGSFEQVRNAIPNFDAQAKVMGL